jgi:hypothetical protein
VTADVDQNHGAFVAHACSSASDGGSRKPSSPVSHRVSSLSVKPNEGAVALASEALLLSVVIDEYDRNDLLGVRVEPGARSRGPPKIGS